MSKPFRFTGRIRSIQYAVRGIVLMVQTQRNARIHAAVTVVVIAAGFWIGLSPSEWCWIVLAIGSVWTAEGLNTAFEFLADLTTKEFHPEVEKCKDVAAGAVLITAIAALAIGALVFIPHLLR